MFVIAQTTFYIEPSLFTIVKIFKKRQFICVSSGFNYSFSSDQEI